MVKHCYHETRDAKVLIILIYKILGVYCDVRAIRQTLAARFSELNRTAKWFGRYRRRVRGGGEIR